MPVFDAHSWEVLPFGDKTALIDFFGTHELFIRALTTTIRRLGGAPFALLPLGDGPPLGDWIIADQQADWLLADQQAHEGAARSLLIADPVDLSSYDLTNRDEWATWTFLHARDCVRLRQAAGL